MRWYGFLFIAVARNATLHAATAERSAAAATRAAKVASTVAAHSAEMHEHARTALKHARTALHDADSNAGLTASQKSSLEKADNALEEATKKVTAEQQEQVDWVKEQLDTQSTSKSSREATERLEAQIRDLEKHLSDAEATQDVSATTASQYDQDLKDMKKRLDDQLKSENAASGPSESAGRMQDELEKMDRQLDILEDTKRLEARVDGRKEPMTEESAELRKQMKELEKMLGKLDGGSNVTELEGELNRLKKAVVGRIRREDDIRKAREEARKAAAAKAKKPRRIGDELPYGDLEPFGREDTAQELTDDSMKESDAMVDQIEKAEIAEEKRAVFRSLTRLRGAAITSFDGVARSQTGNIDEYAHTHQWRGTHPLHHLADEESDVSKWAFPNAD